MHPHERDRDGRRMRETRGNGEDDGERTVLGGERKGRPDERWDNPVSGQRRRSETVDCRDEGDETAHGGKGVVMKLCESER